MHVGFRIGRPAFFVAVRSAVSQTQQWNIAPRSPGTLICTMLLVIVQLISPSPSAGQEVPELQINSKRYILVDIETGNVFAQKDARDQVAIASLTKVFTAAQALEMAPLDAPIVTADSDLRSPEGDYFGSSGTLMGFGVDETYTLEDMIYGMLLPSGNDAANAIARTLGAQPGDSAEQATQRFMDQMNQRLGDIGLKDTHLVNPHGWGVPDHHSSAWDVAAFTRFISANRVLVEIMGTRSYTTSNGFLTISSTNRLLSDYDPLIGGKTGYDLDAGYCLVSIAGQGDQQVVAVTLDGIAPGDWYDDNRVLLEYGFEQQSNLLESNEPFEGEVAAFIDPAAAELTRFAKSSGSFAPAGAVIPPITAEATGALSRTNVSEGTQGRREDSTSLVDRRSATWILATVAVVLVVFRGLLTFRRFPAPTSAVDRPVEDP